MVSTGLNTRHHDGHVVVTLHGELDVTGAAGIAAALAAIVARDPDIIIDLAALDFTDCAGLRVLAGARDQARRGGGDLLLAAPQRQVLRILALTGLDAVFCIHASVEQAAGSILLPAG
jgi:anti-sigma B factor antagonist